MMANGCWAVGGYAPSAEVMERRLKPALWNADQRASAGSVTFEQSLMANGLRSGLRAG